MSKMALKGLALEGVNGRVYPHESRFAWKIFGILAVCGTAFRLLAELAIGWTGWEYSFTDQTAPTKESFVATARRTVDDGSAPVRVAWCGTWDGGNNAGTQILGIRSSVIENTSLKTKWRKMENL
jgi:hypothetical protein